MRPKLGSKVMLTEGMAVGEVRKGILRSRDGEYHMIEVILNGKPVLAERYDCEFEVVD